MSAARFSAGGEEHGDKAMSVRVIEVNKSVYAQQEKLAEETRELLKKKGILLLNVMASPGAGKTSVLLRTAAMLRDRYRIGVMEADIDATVDAEKMAAAGIASIQVHTGGECAMTAQMTRQALDGILQQETKEGEGEDKKFDLLFLENVGNLVCPAEEDVGASLNIEILSIPEGDDKPLKYPLMFQVTQAVLINKTDTREYFPFDDAAVVRRIHALNPETEIFFVSAKTGEGFEAWTEWLEQKLQDTICG